MIFNLSKLWKAKFHILCLSESPTAPRRPKVGLGGHHLRWPQFVLPRSTTQHHCLCRYSVRRMSSTFQVTYAPAKRGHILAATLCPTTLPKRGNIVARRVDKRNVSVDFQKHFCVSAINDARVAKRVNIWETWSHWQFRPYNVSSFCWPLKEGFLRAKSNETTPLYFDVNPPDTLRANRALSSLAAILHILHGPAPSPRLVQRIRIEKLSASRLSERTSPQQLHMRYNGFEMKLFVNHQQEGQTWRCSETSHPPESYRLPGSRHTHFPGWNQRDW